MNAEVVSMGRRDALRILAATGAASMWGTASAAGGKIRSRPIPVSGESLPVIGLGTSVVFDVGTSAAELAPRKEILKLMREHGASVVDTSPMYGKSENVIGVALDQLDARASMFLATKVWTEGRDAGRRQMQRSAELMRTGNIDLMQVHNLLDLDTQLGSIDKLKEAEKIRYSGVTHYRVDAFDRLAGIMRAKPIDFVQLNYSIITREAERELLPLAADEGIAIIVNRTFEDGRLFNATRGKPLPAFAADIGISSWGQYFLKFVLAHPAVTVVIPGTSKPKHMLDNLQAGYGRLPDAKERAAMVKHIESI